MTKEMKILAIRGCVDMQKQWLDTEVDELFLEEPFSIEWSLELLDVAGLCSKFHLTLPYSVYHFMIRCWFDWESLLIKNYPLWAERKKSKGYTTMSYADATRSLDLVRLSCQE